MKKLFVFLMVVLVFAGIGCTQDSYIEFTSTPPGALVEIGVDIEGDKFKPGTGRQIGTTPIKVVLEQNDIDDNGKVNFIMLRGGLTTIGQVTVGRPTARGKIYTYHQRY